MQLFTHKANNYGKCLGLQGRIFTTILNNPYNILVICKQSFTFVGKFGLKWFKRQLHCSKLTSYGTRFSLFCWPLPISNQIAMFNCVSSKPCGTGIWINYSNCIWLGPYMITVELRKLIKPECQLFQWFWSQKQLMTPCYLLFMVAYKLRLISRVTGSNAKDIDMIFPIKLANFLAGMSCSPKASCNCYLSLTSLWSGTKNSPLAKSVLNSMYFMGSHTNFSILITKPVHYRSCWTQELSLKDSDSPSTAIMQSSR